MALISCPECGKEISDQANECPNCGCPVDKMDIEKDVSGSTKNTQKQSPKDAAQGYGCLIVIIIVFSVIIGTCNSTPTPSPTPSVQSKSNQAVLDEYEIKGILIKERFRHRQEQAEIRAILGDSLYFESLRQRGFDTAEKQKEYMENGVF